MSENVVLSKYTLNQHFHLTAGFLTAKKTCGNHSRVVEDQQITWLKQAGKIGKPQVPGVTGQPIEAEQPGRTALFEGIPGDKLIR